MLKQIQKFLYEEHAATTVEYAVMIMLIVTVCIVGIQSVGTHMEEVWQDNATKMNSAINP